jgi:hypothetical protein
MQYPMAGERWGSRAPGVKFNHVLRIHYTASNAEIT